MRKIHLDEQAVIALYEKVETTGAVAREFNVSNETIRRILKRHGIKRTHRHPELEPKVKKSHCHSKYCPAIIVMLHNAFGWNANQIAEATGYGCSGTRTVLVKRGLIEQQHRVNKSDFDLDQIEREYLDGATTYELGKKYGVNPTTISTWMCERGICLGKGAHQEGRNGQDMIERHEQAEREFAERVIVETNGHFEYAGKFRIDGDRGADVRCAICGYTFHRYELSRLNLMTCPKCIESEHVVREQHRDQEKEARRYERMFEEIREYALNKTCKICGSTFHSVRKTALYCSDRCRNRANERRSNRLHSSFHHYYHVKYGELYLEHYDPSITLKKLYERDGGVCQICGKPCDWNDTEWGSHGPTYPSIDHIVPRAKGGEHKWSNVQLAHCICNSRKRDLPDDEAREMVMSDVKVAC